MSRLEVFHEGDALAPLSRTADGGEIASILDEVGVRFERWPTRDLPEGASGDAILKAYASEIDRLRRARGYRSVDVIEMTPDHPERTILREKFLSEHRHDEDEVRFFVEGAGLFTMRRGDRVYNLLCEAGDLVSVPAGTKHWFDMGASPRFTAIRLFDNPEGWIARFTGDEIATRFPRHEPSAA